MMKMAKQNKRDMTSFFGHELLFDYISGYLDEDRRKSVEAFLKNSQEAQQDLIKIMNGIRYAEQLSETVVSQNVIEKVREPETYLSVMLQKSKFDQWPVSIKWSIEALMVVTGIVTLLVLIPWDKALRLELTTPSSEVILAEVKRSNKNEASEKPPVETPEFADEIQPPVNVPTKATVKTVEPPVVATKTAQSAPKPIKEIPTETTSMTEVAAVTEPVPTIPAETTRAALPAIAASSEEKIVKASSGSLFRGNLKITNAEAISPKITEKIQALGGRKAGEVELGWKKSENSYYYHFTLPEAKYEELQQFLAQYAQVNIQKENHPRIMPDGIIRLIIQVEEK